MKLHKATFAAGCFWHVQFTFSELKGVLKTTAGYGGGKVKNPTYEQVCMGKTGHAEAVSVEFDSAVVSYQKLLDTFWEMHDPTQMNRQGSDVGSQYRSVIFYHTQEQREKAIVSLKQEEKRLGKKIVTQIVPFENFYPAEEHHQDYFKKTGRRVCGV